VRDNFIAPGLIFSDSDFREIGMNAFFLKYQDAGDEMPMLQCSASFITLFKTRYRLTFHTIHFKRRPSQMSSDRDGSAPSRIFRKQCPGIESSIMMSLHGSFTLMVFSHGRTWELSKYKQRLLEMKRKTLLLGFCEHRWGEACLRIHCNRQNDSP
jgi:hypothetical protein